MLDSNDIVAGVGFAATLSFFTISLSIGFTIAMAALVSTAIGKNDAHQARRYVVNITALTLLLTGIVAGAVWFNLPVLLTLLGASGPTLDIAISYLEILLPSFPVIAMGMALSAALRAVGDAKLSMTTTLSGACVNAVLDPIFIFLLAMGVEGAALASVVSRFIMLFIAVYGIHNKHRLFKGFSIKEFCEDLRPISKIAGPAILTNMATPIGNAIVIKVIAQYGASFVAGYAIIGRVSMVAFGLVFALSGAISPIFGQNYGAGNYRRIQQTLTDALKFNALYVVAVALLIYLIQDFIINLFKLSGDAADILALFCTWIAITYVFNGVQFIANSAFNNLGKPMYSTWFNLGRATIGTIPFVIIGGNIGQAGGVLIGQAIGGTIFALAALAMASRHIKRLKENS